MQYANVILFLSYRPRGIEIFKTKNNREEQTRRNNTNRPCGCLFFIDRICTHLLTPSLMRCLYVTIFNEFSIRTHHKTACGKYLYVYILIFCACICDIRFFFFSMEMGFADDNTFCFMFTFSYCQNPFFAYMHACMIHYHLIFYTCVLGGAAVSSIYNIHITYYIRHDHVFTGIYTWKSRRTGET